MTHSANELLYTADILGPDLAPRVQGIRMGVTDLSGKRLEQAQLIAAETSHMILARAADITALDNSCYIVVSGTTYVVDYTTDPRKPRPGVWTEIYCHVENGNPVSFVYGLDGGTF